LLGCMTVGLHELFFMRSFVEIAAYYWAAYRGWGFLLGCIMMGLGCMSCFSCGVGCMRVELHGLFFMRSFVEIV
jgi:hypothetical protein